MPSWYTYSPVKNGNSSERVRSSPSANAIVDNFFIEFNRSCYTKPNLQLRTKTLSALTWTSSFLNSSINTAIGYNWLSPSFVVIFKSQVFVARSFPHDLSRVRWSRTLPLQFTVFKIFCNYNNYVIWFTNQITPSQIWTATYAPGIRGATIGAGIPKVEATRSEKGNVIKCTRPDRRFAFFYLIRTVMHYLLVQRAYEFSANEDLIKATQWASKNNLIIILTWIKRSVDISFSFTT